MRRDRTKRAWVGHTTEAADPLGHEYSGVRNNTRGTPRPAAPREGYFPGAKTAILVEKVCPAELEPTGFVDVGGG